VGGGLLISVSNQVTTPIYFLCGIEQQINGHWREVVLDVSNVKPSKSGKVQRVESHTTVSFVWPRKAYVDFLASPEGAFRVKVTPTTRLGAPTDQLIYSARISLKK